MAGLADSTWAPRRAAAAHLGCRRCRHAARLQAPLQQPQHPAELGVVGRPTLGGLGAGRSACRQGQPAPHCLPGRRHNSDQGSDRVARSSPTAEMGSEGQCSTVHVLCQGFPFPHCPKPRPIGVHVIPSTMAAAGGSRVASMDRLASLPESLAEQELEGAAAVEVSAPRDRAAGGRGRRGGATLLSHRQRRRLHRSLSRLSSPHISRPPLRPPPHPTATSGGKRCLEEDAGCSGPCSGSAKGHADAVRHGARRHAMRVSHACTRRPAALRAWRCLLIGLPQARSAAQWHALS